MLTSQPVDDSDSSSDYGPDFTSDEEALINELLAKVATEHPPPPPSHLPSLTPVRDIEDYDPHPRLRSPKILGREKSSPLRPPPLPAASNAVPIDRSPPTTSKCPPLPHDIRTDTDEAINRAPVID